MIDEKANYSYNIYRRGVIRGEIVYLLFVENGDRFAIKVSKYKSLKTEYESAKEAFRVLNKYISVPEPLYYSDELGISLMISRGIRFVPLTKALATKYPNVFRSGLFEYIDTSKEHFVVNHPTNSHSDIVDKMAIYFRGTAISSLLLEWLGLIGNRKLNSISHVKQHGDFGAANVGISSNQISVIDWEDHGKLTLPGIDVLTVCVSYLKVDEKKIERLIYQKEPDNLSEVIHYFCTVYGMRYELFTELVPLYLVNFLYLKRKYGYGEEIINQVEKVALLFFKKVIEERQVQSK
ncbi:MAG: hypothetical protein V3U75_05750 [Methylococcaceae bacterium]